MTIHSPRAIDNVLVLPDRRGRVVPTRVELPERFDCHRIAPLTRAAGSSDLVVDARAVRFADETAIGALVDARLERLSAGFDMKLLASDYLRVILELTGDDGLLGTADVFATVTSMEEAA